MKTAEVDNPGCCAGCDGQRRWCVCELQAAEAKDVDGVGELELRKMAGKVAGKEIALVTEDDGGGGRRWRQPAAVGVWRWWRAMARLAGQPELGEVFAVQMQQTAG